VHELLVNDDLIKQAIAKRAPVEDVRRLAVAGGMTTLLQDGIEKAICRKNRHEAGLGRVFALIRSFLHSLLGIST